MEHHVYFNVKLYHDLCFNKFQLKKISHAFNQYSQAFNHYFFKKPCDLNPFILSYFEHNFKISTEKWFFDACVEEFMSYFKKKTNRNTVGA